jgi:hypothetical protein
MAGAHGGQLGRAVARPFVAVNNLFDQRYVGSVTINGFDRVANAPRVIEPAPQHQRVRGRGGGLAGAPLRQH